MYLLRFNNSGKCLDDDVWAIPEFKAVLEMEQGEKLFYCLALSVDYKTPYRHYQEKDRLPVIFKDQFGKTRPEGVNWRSKKVRDCIDKYRELQYDDLEEDLRVIRNNINDINELLSVKITLENAEAIGKVMERKGKFIDQRDKIMKKIEDRGALSDLDVSDKVNLSRLELRYEKNKAIGKNSLI